MCNRVEFHGLCHWRKAIVFGQPAKSGQPAKDEFESLNPRKSNWTPPEGQFASVDLFVKKCRQDIRKLNFNHNIKYSNLTGEECAAFKTLRNRKDIVIKPADKGGAVVVWRTDLYKQEAARQLADTKFYAKTNKDLTLTNQKIIKDTVNDLISKQELPSTARNLIIITPRTSHSYFIPKIATFTRQKYCWVRSGKYRNECCRCLSIQARQ